VPNVQWKNPDDGQRNCPKHVEFLDKSKFGKLVRLLVLLKNCYDARSLLYVGECSICMRLHDVRDTGSHPLKNAR
jgi:hypothetical protein